MADDTRLDMAVLVPFQPVSGHAIEPLYRQTMGGRIYAHILRGYSELASYLGRDLLLRGDHRPAFGPEREPVELTVHRSLTAVALATHLERAGLRWKVIDPGQRDVWYWRRELRKLKPLRPRSIGVSTTFILGGRWIRSLIAAVRQELPESKLILGGYYYTSDATDFLSLDADVYCIGAGEERIERIAAAIRDGARLEEIPGLYLRRRDGPHEFTGRAESLHLNALPSPDWSLANRIDPPCDPDRDLMDIGVESQRGCVFNCEFCTYRTLSTPDFLDVTRTVDRIVEAGATSRRGILRLTDSTATFPHERWEDLLHRLIDRGGAPHRLWAYARVSDIDEPIATLMAKAGIREVFIGQESGDQRVLNLMRKGTHLSQLKPALAALQRNGVWAFVSFLHGFPGESPESIQNTRAVITSLNADFPAEAPAAAWYNVNPFLIQDFAAVAEKTQSQLKGEHYLGFDRNGENSTQRMAEECLTTVLAAARVPHAPVFVHILTLLDTRSHGAAEPSPGLMAYRQRGPFQRWLKAVERGITLFVERDIEGTPIHDAQLRRAREVILAGYPTPPSTIERLATQVVHRVITYGASRIGREWRAEQRQGEGLATRLLVGGQALLDTQRVAEGWRALRTGEYLSSPAPATAPAEVRDAARDLASGAISEARDNAKRVTKIVREANEPSKAMPAVTG
jgi:hypothetical protein